ncbi:MAG: hypothetical protein JKY56_02970, partial [Kofleriaceae bacterium]|nr:hypothetical protein [Kofleriaceae bacterium]
KRRVPVPAASGQLLTTTCDRGLGATVKTQGVCLQNDIVSEESGRLSDGSPDLNCATRADWNYSEG